jgi:poly(3-hydroxybutyrate) depolymerase
MESLSLHGVMVPIRFFSLFHGRTGLDRLLLLFLLGPLSTVVVAAPADGPQPIELREGLSLKRTGSRGRSTVFTDPVEALVVAGKWKIPAAGETMVMPDGSTQAWENITANPDGWFTGEGARGGHVVIPYVADHPGVWVLEAAGHNMVYVNGEPRAGDVYGYGFARMPIFLRAGTNDLLFVGGRGRLRARLVRPRAAHQFNRDDATLPDLVVGERADTWGAVIVLNASLERSARLEIVATLSGQSNRTSLPPLPPLSMRKVGFRLAGPAPSEAGTVPLILELKESESGSEGGLGLDRIELKLRARRPEQSRKITFRSQIDGSVQYYAVNPGRLPEGAPSRPALVLTLHGAGVEAIGQADAYAPKTWAVLVAPTNRRPYGFDWEEWGRMDTIEVLALARERLHPDPSLVYLTGHSMGGHGVWNVGANFPDQFAAIGPSAGWISFWSYGGSKRGPEPDAVERMLLRGMANSDTLGLSTNFLHYGVYILHGEADDNVPVKEARAMRERLFGFHHDYDWHEEPKAGHWWDNSDEPGAACVDWPPLFDFFARHRRPDPDAVRKVNFTTVNPGVSATSRWAAVLQQVHPLIPSHIDLQWDPGRRRFRGSTENVAALSLQVPPVPEASALIAELDGQSLTN